MGVLRGVKEERAMILIGRVGYEEKQIGMGDMKSCNPLNFCW